jgi:uncharacterized membrane protein YphA (DoxX/SURF4 family)
MNPQQAIRALSLLRIAVGLWLLHSALSHLVWLPYPWATPGWMDTLARQLELAAQSHPIPGVKGLIATVFYPNTPTLAGLDVLLKLAAGVSLTLGAFTVLGSLLALAISLSYLVLFGHVSDLTLGLYGLLTLNTVLFLLTRAGRAWGVDALLATVKGRALFW